jgi:hypothetical protein
MLLYLIVYDNHFANDSHFKLVMVTTTKASKNAMPDQVGHDVQKRAFHASLLNVQVLTLAVSGFM